MKTDWARIDAMTDADIDYSDIPELDNNFFKNAKIVMPPSKRHVSMRLDADMIDWYRNYGKNYQVFMNAVLRAYYEAHRTKSSR